MADCAKLLGRASPVSASKGRLDLVDKQSRWEFWTSTLHLWVGSVSQQLSTCAVPYSYSDMARVSYA